MRRLLLALALRVASSSSPPLIADDPYIELVPLRRPFHGSWPAGAVPSSWSELPAGCAAAGGGPLFLAWPAPASASPRALLLCADGALLDVVSGARLPLSGLPTGAAPAVVAAGAGGAEAAAAAYAADAQALYRVTCAAQGCAAAALALHGVGAAAALLPFADAAAPAGGGAVLFVTGARGTAAWVVNASGAVEVWRTAAAYAALAHSAVLGEVALGNATKVELLDARAGSAPVPPPPPRHARDTRRWGGGGGGVGVGVGAPAARSGSVFPSRRWLWVTNASAAWGGEVDDGVAALAYDDGPAAADGGGSGGGTLYVGGATCLNVLHANGTTERIDGARGLPVGNITSIAIGPGGAAGAQQRSRLVWLGTRLGVVAFDPFAAPDVVGLPFGAPLAAGAPPPPPGAPAYAPRWRYLAGPRWLPAAPGAAAPAAGCAVSPAGLALLPAAAAAPLHIPVGAGGARGARAYGAPAPDAALALVLCGGGGGGGGGGGLAVLQPQAWRLADKAALWARYTPGHIVDGQANDCGYASFGASGACAWSPGANDGLWSSLLVAAEAWRWAVTRAPDALAGALTLLGGLRAINEATGVRGLIARAAIDPAQPAPAPDPNWHVSSSLPGWHWLGDASSDEVVGHALAYPLLAAAAAAAGNASARAAAAGTLVDLARYIVRNNFTLVDVTGRPTQWGRWDPAAVGGPHDGGEQARSDNRGENSLEILALLSGAIQFAAPGSPDEALFRDAYAYLAYDEDYISNLANLRISAPCDVNYSDDELEAFSYLALVLTGDDGDALQAPVLAAARASLRRSWRTALAAQRSALWVAIYLACTGAAAPAGAQPPPPPPDAETLAAAADAAWNLRGWALEAADWPAANSQRADLLRDPAADRFGGADALVVLPQRERAQQRWNADMFQLDGGGGGGEADPGAFLMAYWALRYFQILGE